jgi:hypothetical protein
MITTTTAPAAGQVERPRCASPELTTPPAEEQPLPMQQALEDALHYETPIKLRSLY